MQRSAWDDLVVPCERIGVYVTLMLVRRTSAEPMILSSAKRRSSQLFHGSAGGAEPDPVKNRLDELGSDHRPSCQLPDKSRIVGERETLATLMGLVRQA
jgi:hypothetical protein